MKQLHKTARGKHLDMNALRLKNETVRAVGNMGVNARGDLVDPDNNPIDSRNRSVSRHYSKQLSNVTDDAVVAPKKQTASKKSAAASTQPVVSPEPVVIPPTPEDFDDDYNNEQAEPTAQLTGIKAAMAKAKQSKSN